jgi:hypothetical protein
LNSWLVTSLTFASVHCAAKINPTSSSSGDVKSSASFASGCARFSAAMILFTRAVALPRADGEAVRRDPLGALVVLPRFAIVAI